MNRADMDKALENTTEARLSALSYAIDDLVRTAIFPPLTRVLNAMTRVIVALTELVRKQREVK